MKILVFGRTGQLAAALARLDAPGSVIETLGRDQADLTRPEECASRVAVTDADVVINAAAYTAVDRAEEDVAAAEAVNAVAPAAMARAAAARGLPFLHVSTDYVFDGRSHRPWREDDPVAPLGVYGRTKLEGERAVAAVGGPHVILRTAWVFSADGGNFVRTMLRVGRDRDRLTVVDDQRGGPTAAADIAAALMTIARAWVGGRGVPGVFHFCGAPTVSWCGFAQAVFERAPWPQKPEVAPISTADWPTRAERPGFSALDCGRIAAAYGVAQPDWRPALDGVVEALEAQREGKIS
jgi:dTDP-4-dehydrorhamnose reductase